ncbi:MAG: tRNA epoxyqueuosine(34) reductase QueG [Thermoguttaceae bacterium]
MFEHELTAALRSEAARLGFCQVGVCDAVESPRYDRLREWLLAGYAGQMHFLADRLEAYRHPGRVLEGARSMLVLATDYRTVEPGEIGGGWGRVSRYAWGMDYHDLLRSRLNRLAEFHRRLVPDQQVRGVVDTSPLMEREFAVLAGLGWIGKNTLLLTRERGSWVFLSVLLTTAKLEADGPFAADHCGTCRACVEACPTGALVKPYVLDARRCISYLTIELRELPPPELRGALGEWLFGCDICQDVCPWNQRLSRRTTVAEPEEQFQPIGDQTCLDLVELFSLDDESFRSRYRRTPLWRAKRRGLLRNAALVLGAHRLQEAADALICGLNDYEPLVRHACAWAMRGLEEARTGDALRQRLAVETDDDVRKAIVGALSERAF